MKKLLLSLALALIGLTQASATSIKPSTTLPSEGIPEYLYSFVNGNGLAMNGYTGTTQTEANYGYFAFYAVDDVANAYYMYSYTAEKWITYTPAASYSNKKNFVTLSTTKQANAYFRIYNFSGNKIEFQPFTTGGSVNKYLNWYQGVDANPLDDTSVTLGLWEQSGSQDNGSYWNFSEVSLETYTLDIEEAGVSVTIFGHSYSNGDTYLSLGTLNSSDVKAPAIEGKTAVVVIDNTNFIIHVRYITFPAQDPSEPYTLAQVYPTQQTAVGAASVTHDGDVWTLSNNVLKASFMKVGSALFFAGSRAMNLEPGTEPFLVSFGSGTTVPASAMNLESVETEDLSVEPDAVGGAEHFPGKALVAKYNYTYGGSTAHITWKAILRDGSHYLRSEVAITAEGDLDMYDIIPLKYNVNCKGIEKPAVVGNTRGAVIMSNTIFAGLENPVAYNTVGESGEEDDQYDLTKTYETISIAASSWTQMNESEVPERVIEVTGKQKSQICEYKTSGYALLSNQKVVVKVSYKSGNHRLRFGGCDLLDATGKVVASDYHSGNTGTTSSNNSFTFVVPFDGTFTIRTMIENASEVVDASSDMVIKVYTPKPGVVITTDNVPIQGRWSRNTTLADGETWKISGVVGLIAQDANSSEISYNKNQKRRSFLAYSERERAVPWRPYPCYISWYELNINRNNAAAPGYVGNMTSDQCADVVNHWKTVFYDEYNESPAAFVFDDGWDEYGTWTFNCNFPDGFRDADNAARAQNSGIGAWLGPVGGYGQSGNYRRAYWSGKGGMQLSNPAYYKVFLDAAKNLTVDQGYDFRFFKFDGISAQFSAVGPDAGDTGNENAEGIIRLEQYVRDNLKRDIFFNTTVGTWASPFWYHITDATWRQENDYGTIGNNAIDRENWITYRDRLVYQNYVTNSPICPINTLMTHGFILSKYGSVSSNKTYDAVVREMRCAFGCGSGMVELYNDYLLMDDIANNKGVKGMLWKELAQLIRWQRLNADVLPDIHWVGGSPWDGSTENIYGWGAWNERKAVLTLRNGDDGSNTKTFTTTLREALNIPAAYTGTTVKLSKAFADQADLQGWPTTEEINIDQTLNLVLPKNTVFMFSTVIPLENVSVDSTEIQVIQGQTAHIQPKFTPADASNQELTWESSNTNIATVKNGVISAKSLGTTVITATSVANPELTFSINLQVIANPNAITVQVDGAEQGGVIYKGKNYTDGEIISPDEEVKASDFTAINVLGYTGEINYDAAQKNVTVTYTSIFSTAVQPRWFQVVFKNSSNVLADQGTDNNLLTAAQDNASDAQLWRFDGNATSCTMVSNLGNYISYSGSGNNLRFKTVASKTSATALRIIISTNDVNYCEIQRKSTTTKSMNQWGEVKAGQEIGEWTAADNNNLVSFVPCTPTSINDASHLSPLTSNLIYNLSGQKLNKAQKGINIINGKKVIL